MFSLPATNLTESHNLQFETFPPSNDRFERGRDEDHLCMFAHSRKVGLHRRGRMDEPAEKMSTERIVKIDPLTDRRWDAFVESHPFGWICHLSGWEKVLVQSFGHMQGHCLALVDSMNDDIRAALPLFEVQSWLTGRRLVSIPFATLSDPLISEPHHGYKLLEAAAALAEELEVSRLEIRTLHSRQLIENSRFVVDPFYKHHYLALNAEPEELRKSFHYKAVRYEINKAEKSDLSFRLAKEKSQLRQFYALYMQTRKRLGLPVQPYQYFDAIWETFNGPGRCLLVFAMHRGELAAAQLYFRFNGRVSMEFEAWDTRFRNLSPNHYLIWKTINLSCREGFQIFDFGRTSPANAALMDFKRRWGTTIVDLPQFCYPITRYNELSGKETSLAYRAVQKACRMSPGILFPFISNLAYRHLG
jgi:CelD/BcsL family acetyltransferase involved in cellulose biosynthesis